MAVKISKLWREGSFLNLSPIAKLFYIYAATAPNINTLGFFNTRYKDIVNDLDVSEEEVIQAGRDLHGWLLFYGTKEDTWIMVKAHYKTLPVSDAVYKKALKDIDSMPPILLGKVQDDGNLPNIEEVSLFTPPTPDEVEDYALSIGYPINGQTVVDYYEQKAKEYGKKSWTDSRGKQVKNWKGKVRSVWCRNVEKLEPVEGAPKGFEFFCVKDDNGNMIRPNRWKHNKPYGNGLLEDKLLQQAFNLKV